MAMKAQAIVVAFEGEGGTASRGRPLGCWQTAAALYATCECTPDSGCFHLALRYAPHRGGGLDDVQAATHSELSGGSARGSLSPWPPLADANSPPAVASRAARCRGMSGHRGINSLRAPDRSRSRVQRVWSLAELAKVLPADEASLRRRYTLLTCVADGNVRRV
jgi:hypothetical protein